MNTFEKIYWAFVVIFIVILGLILVNFTANFYVRETFISRRKKGLIRQESFPILNELIEEGKIHFSNEKVIVCGLARNIEKSFSSLVELLKNISSLFKDYLFIFVENDSRDQTRKLLFDLKNSSSYGFDSEKIHILKLDPQGQTLVVDDETPWILNLPVECGRETSRIVKMVFLRNVYLKYINENIDNPTNYKYTFIIDCDSVTCHKNPSWNKSYYSFTERLATSGYYFSKDENIHGIGANTIGLKDYKYYDGFSLDLFPDSLKTFFNGFVTKHPSDVYELFRVKSCFGGLTIYRTDKIIGKYYKTYLWIDLLSSSFSSFSQFKFPICEHKPFNYEVGNLYINPRLLIFVDSF